MWSPESSHEATVSQTPRTHDIRDGTPLSSLSPPVALHAHLNVSPGPEPGPSAHEESSLFSSSHESLAPPTNHRVSSPVVEDLAMASEEKLR